MSGTTVTTLSPLSQLPPRDYACSASVVPSCEAELTLFKPAAGRVADKGYAFAALVDANAGVSQGNLTARTSDGWLADLFRRIVSWIRDGHDNRQIREELHWNLGQHLLHCISDTEASLGRLMISAGSIERIEHNAALTAPQSSEDPGQHATDMYLDLIETEFTRQVIGFDIKEMNKALRQHLAKLKNIHLNLHAIVEPGIRWPLDMRDVAWIADEFLALSERSHNLNEGALKASMSAGLLACGLPPASAEAGMTAPSYQR